MTHYEKLQLQREIEQARREVTNAKRRHARQEQKLMDQHIENTTHIESYFKSAINDLILSKRNADKEANDIIYNAIQRLEHSHKAAMATISQLQSETFHNKVMQNISILGRFERELEDLQNLQKQNNDMEVA